jgi:hypothetical protein
MTRASTGPAASGRAVLPGRDQQVGELRRAGQERAAEWDAFLDGARNGEFDL